MSENEPYRHEDIEALLMSKAFDELLSEEKAFVMQHVQNEEEYNSLRSLLLEMHELSFDAELKDPPESLETALLHGFAENAEKVKGYKQRFAPWMGWAIAASVVGFCVMFFWPKSERVETAEVEQRSDAQPAEGEQPSSDQPKQEQPKPAVQVPSVTLPAEVENLLAQVVPASTPEPPVYAESLYEYEDALKAVSLTEEASDEPASESEFAPVELDKTVVSADEIAKEDVAMSAAPTTSGAAAAESLSSTQAMSAKKISAETKALGKANRKKSRNPDVLKLSQSKKLKSLLRSE
jgi:hypothetical protein